MNLERGAGFEFLIAGLDFIARLTGEYLSRSFGQQFVVENKVGAGGTIGIETAAKSPADGYSILISNDNVASAPHIMKVSYQGQPAYLFVAPCCDQFNQLYDTRGVKLCAPSGGLSGHGDGKCKEMVRPLARAPQELQPAN